VTVARFAGGVTLQLAPVASVVVGSVVYSACQPDGAAGTPVRVVPAGTAVETSTRDAGAPARVMVVGARSAAVRLGAAPLGTVAATPRVRA